MCWLNTECNKQLRDLVNNERICHFDQSFNRAHHAICIMMDRVDDSAEWLNRHGDFPDNVADFLLFLVHGDIVCKTVLKAIGKLNLDNPYGNDRSVAARRYLSNYCSDGLSCEGVSDMPNDKTIWSYLRALVFAHTEETAAGQYQGSFLQKGEKQYSPFPLVDKDKKKLA